MTCEATSGWYVGVVEPSTAERIALQVAAASRGALQVLNFRWIQKQMVLEGGERRHVAFQYHMLPGYLFLKGLGALHIKDLPFAPRLLKHEDDFMMVSDEQVVGFLIQKHEEAPKGSIFEGDKIIVPNTFELPENYGVAHRKMARKQREIYIKALAA